MSELTTTTTNKQRITNRLRRKLRQTCLRSKQSFTSIHNATVLQTEPGLLIHVNNGANILGVAHLDYVTPTPVVSRGGLLTWNKSPRGYLLEKQQVKESTPSVYEVSQGIVTSHRLDDRLGVWVLLHLLPSLHCVPFDILLTDNEEQGMSTARDFTTAKQYNWIFQFDRAGDDCVLYDYHDGEYAFHADGWQRCLSDSGWKIGGGSYTDICDLQHLGCKGVNIGTGYHNQHSFQCFAKLADTVRNAKRFIRFARDHHATHFPHIDTWRDMRHDSGLWKSADRTALDYDYVGYCTLCGGWTDDDWRYCPYCGTKITI